MDQDFNLNFKVNTSDAVQGLNNLKGAADQAAESVGKIGEKAGEAASEVSKVGDAADQSLPKVQGLGSAFESAFTSAIQLGSQTKGTLGEIFKSVNKAIPTVKKLNSTAISGLTGIRKALLATGIGAAIVAIGTLTTHWEGFLHAVGSSKEEFDQFKTKALGAIASVASAAVGGGNVLLQALLTPFKLLYETGRSTSDFFVNLLSFNFAGAKEAANTGGQKIKEAFLHGIDIKGNYEVGKEVGQKIVDGIVTTFTYKAPEIQDTVSDNLGGGKGNGTKYKTTGKKIGKELGEGIQEELVKSTKETVNEILEEYSKATEGAEDVRKDLEDYYKHLLKIQELQKKEESQPSHLVAGTEVNKLGGDLLDKLATASQKYESNVETVKKALEEAWSSLNDIDTLLATNPSDPDLLQVWQTLYSETQKWSNLLIELEKDYNLQEKDLRKENLEDAVNYVQDLTDLGVKARQDMIDRDPFKSNYRKDTEILGLEKERLESQLITLRQLQSGFDENSKEWKQYQLQIEQVLSNLTALQDEYFLSQVAHVKESVLLLAEAAQSIASIYGTMAQAEEDRIQRMLDNKEIEEKDAKEMFERVKKWQLAENWINTLSGMTAALTSPVMQGMGVPGWIAAATQAAALLANGLAQDKKIRSTQFGSGASGGGSGISAPSVGVTPLQVTDDIQVSPSALAQSQNPADQRVYILESDLQESDRRVEIREANTSF